MTRRPRSHELESRSRIAFSASLPSGWVFRDLAPDYGLDGLVEVFDERGLATGHLFFVQLKATDRTATPLLVRLPRRTRDYYATLVLPVLLVLFQAPRSALYARWVSSHSPSVPGRGSASHTIRLSPADRWSPEQVPTVLEELASLREAMRLGSRESRIRRYYKAKRSINLAEKARGSSPPVQRFRPGERVVHGAFGLGTVNEESENYVFVQFDEDEVVRKFLPGSTWEFTKLKPANAPPRGDARVC